MFEQRLLQVAITEAASAQTVFEVERDRRGRNKAQQLDREVLVGVGLGLTVSRGLTEAMGSFTTRLKITPTRVWTTPTG